MEWIRRVRCEKNPIWIRPRDMERFRTGVCALRKCYETHLDMGLGSNVVDWTHSLCKIPIWTLPHYMVHQMHFWDQFSPVFVW
jgi:hypothetical protein